MKETLRPTMLIVDDASAFRESLRSLLEAQGFIVKEAASVEQARELMRLMAIDLALTDLRLTMDADPGDCSGLEVAQCAAEYGIPTLVLTAFPSAEAARQSMRTRGAALPLAWDFVPKADGPHAILDSIERLNLLSDVFVLHISDLHLGSPLDHTPSNQKPSLRTFQADIRRLREERKIGRIGAVVVSGDVSHRCQPEGFDQAFQFLDELCEALMIPRENVILAPGNHDVYRAKAGRARRPSLHEAQDFRFGKFERYLKFTERWYGAPIFDDNKLYHIYDFGRLAIIAFNSCYREGNWAYRCKKHWREDGYAHYCGWIDSAQLEEACEEIAQLKESRKDTLCLAVCHHHVLSSELHGRCIGDHLWDYDERIKFRLAEVGVQILLHGHAHKSQLERAPVPGKLPYSFGSGTPLLPNSSQKWENQYLILELGSDGSRIIMRRFERGERDQVGDWTQDDSVCVGGVVELKDVVLPPLNTPAQLGR